MKSKWFTVICIGLLFFEKTSCKNVIQMSADFDKVLYEQHMKKGIAQNGPSFAFAKHFQDHMVLQQAPRRANIYGFSPDIGQKVIMQLVTVPPTRPYYYETTTVQGPDANLGYWNFMLDPFPSNTTVNINIQAEAGSLNLNDVIFGDVWICSGQSNMQFTVIQMDDAEAELADAANYPNIRLMTVNMNESTTVQYDLIQIEENWTKPSRDTLGAAAWTYFSAVCWLFGKNIHKQRGDPIGLVATDWGGTPVEAWSSPQALAACGDSPKPKVQLPASYRSYLNQLSPKERRRLEGPGDNSVLWNAMVHPLLGMTIYGAIWYQGEADASGARMNNYNCTFPAMINDWRANFNKASNGQTSLTFPFGFVQLSGNSPDPTISVGFPDIRWHQTADVGYVPNQKMVNVFMAVAMDLPDFTSSYGAIHPRDKKDVGARLALSGLAVAYGQSEVFQGPFPAKAYISSVGLVVDYGSSWSLNIKNWEGFELQCGSNWVPTPIISSNQTSVTLFTGTCKPTVTGLRYAWRESPCAMLQCAIYESVNNLPAPPFIAFAKNSNGKPYFTFDEPAYL
ncbi:sialate O-acetylesterase-like isoform X4 [Physella acuta]|uniref:sialate O-acetylesterase-like isoform X2 n=1 Tax=Physella acuta TaxID=109671 RepID=UPI0027DB7205|nr:sialate O-acetylesterase-like isoform X2 [Physella acuta]XP_059172857.1 sialate O-acetylesterase-like isoform X3 [Physella acuta]XP_059172859.1 sialate O-acetylesterase-like isoform X4 [Physella acuta]